MSLKMFEIIWYKKNIFDKTYKISDIWYIYIYQYILLPYQGSCLTGGGMVWAQSYFPIQGACVSANVLNDGSRTPGLGLHSV